MDLSKLTDPDTGKEKVYNQFIGYIMGKVTGDMKAEMLDLASELGISISPAISGATEKTDLGKERTIFIRHVLEIAKAAGYETTCEMNAHRWLMAEAPKIKECDTFKALCEELINRSSDVIWWKIRTGNCIFCGIEHEWDNETGQQRKCTNPTCPVVRARKALEVKE